jgi:hypothetical protein
MIGRSDRSELDGVASDSRQAPKGRAFSWRSPARDSTPANETRRGALCVRAVPFARATLTMRSGHFYGEPTKGANRVLMGRMRGCGARSKKERLR